MPESWLQPVDFPAYLEAKIEVDDESLNHRLFEKVRRRVRGFDSPCILDVGTGTGAMLRRLLRYAIRGCPRLYGLDLERRSLEVAAGRVRGDLEARGWSVQVVEHRGRLVIEGCEGGEQAPGPRVSLVQGGVLDGNLGERLDGGGFDLISAHAFLDLLPLEDSLSAVRRLHRPGGWLYTTLNYDGLTTLFPPYGDPDFESRLMERYELSMEQRRVAGRATAGRWSGRRLYQSLPEHGYTVLAVGASDWTVFPGPTGHSANRRLFLRTLLSFIAREGQADCRLDSRALQRWYDTRLEAVQSGVLAVVAHQLDVLAELQR
jgi:SAM-dependent methyltransferase